jgi:hypothetical protein
LSVNTLYTQAEQTKTIAGIVGSDALAGQYIVPNTEYYLSRGHMAPDGDFIDAASQDASYYFMNAAPQFQTFNNGNWKYNINLCFNFSADNLTHKILIAGGWRLAFATRQLLVNWI